MRKLALVSLFADSVLVKDTKNGLGVNTEWDFGLHQRRLEKFSLGLFPFKRKFLFLFALSVGSFFGKLLFLIEDYPISM